MNIDQ
jgi:hypothetical protein